MKRSIICCCHICGDIFRHETELMSSPLAFKVTDATGTSWTLPCTCCRRDACMSQLNDAWLDPKHAVWKAAGIKAEENAKTLVFLREHDDRDCEAYRLIAPAVDEGDVEHARRAGKVG